MTDFVKEYLKKENDMEVNELSEELQKYLLEHQNELLTHIIQFDDLMNRYESAIKEVYTKLEILKKDLRIHTGRNCITTIQTRIKSPARILNKLNRKGIPPKLESIRNELNDVAGIRVICSFIDDIYMLADKLSRQDDLTVILAKDYIQTPKPNGYRSYHMIVEVPVFFSDAKEYVRVEIQIRTVAMDFWASLEHDIKYKKEVCGCEDILRELKDCADTIASTDQRMMELRDKITKHRKVFDQKIKPG